MAAAGGRSPQSASTSRSRDTTSALAMSRHASSAVCFPGVGAVPADPATTRRGPSTWNSIGPILRWRAPSAQVERAVDGAATGEAAEPQGSHPTETGHESARSVGSSHPKQGVPMPVVLIHQGPTVTAENYRATVQKLAGKD